MGHHDDLMKGQNVVDFLNLKNPIDLEIIPFLSKAMHKNNSYINNNYLIRWACLYVQCVYNEGFALYIHVH